MIFGRYAIYRLENVSANLDVKHYETTQAFIRSLELLAPSLQTVEVMRRDPTYTAFQRRWQLPVYFQLRWKEIVGSLEDILSVERLEPNLKSMSSHQELIIY
jgi:conserved oligomeric Golgi complex subunit 2